MSDAANDANSKNAAKKPVDLTEAYDRAANLMVPRVSFPFFAAFFVLLCGGMATVLFGVGKILGGVLFLCPVAAGLYVAWNNFAAWRDRN